MNVVEVNKICELYCGNGMRRLTQLCYPIIIKIGGISESDYDDFYSIANRTVWEAAMAFDESQNDNFEVFLKGCLDRKFKTEMTRRNRDRRIPKKLIDSLDRPLNDDDDTPFGYTIKSKFDVEDEIEELVESNAVIAYLNSLTPKQKKIARFIIDGYDLQEIKRILGISDEKFSNLLNRMGSFDKRLIFNNAR